MESGAVTRRVRPRSLEIEEGELPGSDDEDGLVYDNDDKGTVVHQVWYNIILFTVFHSKV